MSKLGQIGSNDLDFIGFAIDHGIESIRDGSPLVPFVISKKNNDKNLNRFLGETSIQSIARAEEYVQKGNFDIAIIIYEGFVNFEGEKHEAILAKVFSKNNKFIFAQRYKRDKNQLTKIGDYLYLGDQK